MCGKILLSKNISRHQEQSCKVFCWNKVRANILSSQGKNSEIDLKSGNVSMMNEENMS